MSENFFLYFKLNRKICYIPAECLWVFVLVVLIFRVTGRNSMNGDFSIWALGYGDNLSLLNLCGGGSTVSDAGGI